MVHSSCGVTDIGSLLVDGGSLGFDREKLSLTPDKVSDRVIKNFIHGSCDRHTTYSNLLNKIENGVIASGYAFSTDKDSFFKDKVLDFTIKSFLTNSVMVRNSPLGKTSDTIFELKNPLTHSDNLVKFAIPFLNQMRDAFLPINHVVVRKVYDKFNKAHAVPYKELDNTRILNSLNVIDLVGMVKDKKVSLNSLKEVLTPEKLSKVYKVLKLTL